MIFDIKEMALFDGPGLRQTVFLKGCPLRCSWCQNPEGMEKKPVLMVSWASCLHCNACRNVCPHTSSCNACGACIPVCPLNLRHIVGEEIESDVLVKRLMKDSDYYRRYGGGVTFSGGEPLLQGEFLLEVLEKLPRMHTAIETSGFCDASLFKDVVGALDFIYMDMKLMDSSRHKKYCGVDNKVILENARFLCGSDKPFVIRIPVIPGVNDSEENYRATAKFLKGAKNLKRVELLHYNSAAGAKYSMIGKSYRPDFDPERVAMIDQRPFTEEGIRSVVL